mgnify:CR=1 FL=1
MDHGLATSHAAHNGPHARQALRDEGQGQDVLAVGPRAYGDPMNRTPEQRGVSARRSTPQTMNAVPRRPDQTGHDHT